MNGKPTPDHVTNCVKHARRWVLGVFVLLLLFTTVLFMGSDNVLMSASISFSTSDPPHIAGFYDIIVMASHNNSIGPTSAGKLFDPSLTKAGSDPCARPRRHTGVQDILCMKPPTFLPNYKNPCWYEDKLLRCLPYFHLIGVCKSGTSDFFKRLYVHPDIIPNKGIFGKEIWFWSWKRFHIKKVGNIPIPEMTLLDFTNKFQPNIIRAKTMNMSGYKDYHPAITGHGDPMDFWDRFAWKQTPQNDPNSDEPLWTTPAAVRHINPDVKLILMVRDPVERLYSHYFHSKMGTSSQSFHDHVLMSLSAWEACIQDHTIRACAYNATLKKQLKAPIFTSLYSVHLKEWLSAFPLDQIFVFRNEDYVKDMKGTLLKVFAYLGVDPPSDAMLTRMQSLGHFYATEAKASAGPMKPETRRLLQRFYRPYMEEFSRILGDEKYMWSTADT